MKESKNFVKKIHQIVAVATATFLSGNLYATEQTQPFSSSEALGPLLMALAAIIVCIYAIAWVAKKLNLTPHMNQHFKTVTSVSLGGRERIVVVELNGKQYALGVTSNSINLLFELEDNIENKAFAMQDNKLLNKLTELLNNDVSKVKN